MVKLYCPKCMDVYTPKSSRHHHTDGAYFGTGFPHMLFMVHPEYRPKRPANQFVPRLVRQTSRSLVYLVLLMSINTVFDVYVQHSPPALCLISVCYHFFSTVSMASRSIPWLTSYSCRPPPASRALSRLFARSLGAGRTRRNVEKKTSGTNHMERGHLYIHRCPLPIMKTVLFLI